MELLRWNEVVFRENSLKNIRNIYLSEEFYIDFWLERNSWFDSKTEFFAFTNGLKVTFEQDKPKLRIKTEENDKKIGE